MTLRTVDDIRARYPHLRVTLYALEPGKPVMLELISTDDVIYEFRGATEAEAVAAAFPDEDETPSAAPTPPPINVFD